MGFPEHNLTQETNSAESQAKIRLTFHFVEIFNSLSSMMLFNHSFGLTRSLFISYVHKHDRQGFGMLTVETAVIPRLYLMGIMYLMGGLDRYIG